MGRFSTVDIEWLAILDRDTRIEYFRATTTNLNIDDTTRTTGIFYDNYINIINNSRIFINKLELKNTNCFNL